MRVKDLPMERFIQFILAVSGLGFVACFCMALWLALPAHAASSELILEGMRDGTPIENINILFQQRAATPELEQQREDWIAALKAEIVFERGTASGPDAEARIVRNIAARCSGTEI